MDKLLLLFIIVLPIFLWGNIIFNKRKSDNKKIILELFIGGIMSCFLASYFSFIIEVFLPYFAMSMEKVNPLLLFFRVFIGIALVEEFSKWIFVYFISYQNDRFNYIYDMIVYGVFVSLGFAFYENILYVFKFGFGTGVFRAFTAIPGHICDGIFMGYYFGLSKLSKLNNRKDLYRRNMSFSLIVPILLHGIYDYLVFLDTRLSLYLFYFYLVFIYVIGFKKIRNVSSIKRKMKYKYNYCSNCGSVVESDYCPKCGRKNI